MNADMKETGEELIYLYCVTDSAQRKLARKGGKQAKPEGVKDFPGAGGLGGSVGFISCGKLVAVIGKVRKSEFSEENLKKNLADLEWIKTNASLHEKIIEGVMRDGCVIPFKFATIFNSEDSLKTMLRKHSEQFEEILKNLAGKEEWGVKIYCDKKRLKTFLAGQDEEISEIDKKIASSSPGKAFLLKKKREESIDIAVNKKINEYGQSSFNQLKEQSLQTRINRLLPGEVTEREDDMILNSAFLVDKNKVSAFIGVADILKTRYEKSGLSFDCTGPWPPYNFCSPVDR